MKKITPICYIYKTEIPETDWEKTPASVKERIPHMDLLMGLIAATTSHIRFYGI